MQGNGLIEIITISKNTSSGKSSQVHQSKKEANVNVGIYCDNVLHSY